MEEGFEALSVEVEQEQRFEALVEGQEKRTLKVEFEAHNDGAPRESSITGSEKEENRAGGDHGAGIVDCTWQLRTST